MTDTDFNFITHVKSMPTKNREKAHIYFSNHANSFHFDSSSPIDSYRKSEAKKIIQRKACIGGESVPSTYFFNGKQRKKIIHNIIDGYFQSSTNPETSSRQMHSPTRRLFLKNKSLFVPNNQNQEGSLLPQFKLNRNYGFQNSKSKELEKFLQQPKFSHNYSLIESKLSVIDQKIQHRPFSESKQRYSEQRLSPKLKRRQSAGETMRNYSYYAERNQISLFNESTYERNNSTTSSRLNSKSNYSKKSKYYNFVQRGDKIIKIFHPQGIFLLYKQQKLQKLGAKTLHYEVPDFNQIQFPYFVSLQKQLYTKVTRIHGTQTVHILSATEPTYEHLFTHKNEQLKNIIRSLVLQITSLENKVCINKVTLSNVSRVNQKDTKIIDWSGASIKQQLTNLDNVKLVAISDPLIKQQTEKQQQSYQNIKWICQPEYLAPEIIKCLQTGEIDNESIWNEPRNDIWSLGILIFQILTLIPMNSKQRHSIKGRNVNRKGLFSFSLNQFSYSKLIRKQKLFSSQVGRIVRKQCAQILQKVDNRILLMMQGMLHFQKQNRLKVQQILQLLDF